MTNSKLIILLKSIYYGLETVIERIKNKEKLNNLNILFKLFIIRSFYGLAYFRNLINENNNFLNLKNQNSIQNEDVSQTVESLTKKGHTDEHTFKKNIKDKIEDQFIKNCKNATVTYLNGKTENIRNLSFVSLEEAYRWVKDNDVYIFRGNIRVDSNIFFKKIFLSGYFFEVAKSYLNSKNISLILYLFISENENKINNHNKEKIFNVAAQKYHFDIDYQKFFKLFIYLTDVKMTNDGSHIFIPETHKVKKNSHHLPKRYDNEDIENYYKNKKEYFGNSGTFFLEDTFGIHKGSPILNNSRVMAIVEYGRQHFKLNELTHFE